VYLNQLKSATGLLELTECAVVFYVIYIRPYVLRGDTLIHFSNHLLLIHILLWKLTKVKPYIPVVAKFHSFT